MRVVEKSGEVSLLFEDAQTGRVSHFPPNVLNK